MAPVLWHPDLTTIGLDPTTLPEGWGWTTLNDDELIVCGRPLDRTPHYGEFTVSPIVTDKGAHHHFYRSAQLVVASVSKQSRADEGWLTSDQWSTSLTPWAIAPTWWLLGPQGEAVLAFIERAMVDPDRLWYSLSRPIFTDSKSAAVQQLLDGLPAGSRNVCDVLMVDGRREGSVALAINHAEHSFYGHHIPELRRRNTLGCGIAHCTGDGSEGMVDFYVRDQVRAVDNAIRWLTLRDLLPSWIYSPVAEAWFIAMGWPLHPDDTF